MRPCNLRSRARPDAALRHPTEPPTVSGDGEPPARSASVHEEAAAAVTLAEGGDYRPRVTWSVLTTFGAVRLVVALVAGWVPAARAGFAPFIGAEVARAR